MMDLRYENEVYVFDFTTHPEVQAVAAAYREGIATSLENYEHYEPKDLEFARLPESTSTHTFRTTNPRDILETLDVFHIKTEEAIHEIPSVTRTPKFRSRDILERMEYGKKARELADEAREKIEKIHEDLASQDTDEVIKGFEKNLASIPSQLEDDPGS